MVGEWVTATVGDVFDLVTGYAFKSSDFVDCGVPVIKIKNVKAGKFSEHEFDYVSDEFLHDRCNKLARPGDLLVSMSGNRHDGSPETWVGKVAHFRRPGNYFINQRVGALRVKHGVPIDSRFASFLLSSVSYQDLFIAIATSSGGQANLSPTQILGAPMRYPDFDTQRAIAHILGTLDDKIELNRRMNETLEAMARALFKSWFVDFDPVRAKAAGRDPGLPKEIAALFPNSFQDSELGEIPEGWTVTTLGELSALNPEVWTNQTRPFQIKYVDLSCTKWGHIETVTAYVPADAPSRAQRVLRAGDTIVGTVRPGNGSYALVSESGLTGSTGFAVLRPSAPHYAQLVYLSATAAENIEALAHLADGGAYPAIRPEVVASTPFIRADEKLLEQFSLVSGPLLAKMANNMRESRTLAALRDALLPKLISGELRVAV